MERILAPDSATGEVKLPAKLTRPEVMAEKMARAETSNFSAIGTRKSGQPIYRGAFPKGVENYYSTMWRPMAALLADRLDASFTQVEASVEALFKQWKDLAQKLDQQSPDERRAMLDKEPGLSKEERADIANEQGPMREKSLAKLRVVQTLLTPVLEPVLAAINGDGKSLMSSNLPLIFLHHLIELDEQHTTCWEPASKRLLDWQLFHQQMQDTIAQVNLLRKTDPQAQALADLENELKQNMQQWQQHELALAKKGEDGKAELAALKALTERPTSPTLKLKDQLDKHDAEFRETRHQALEAFLGVRSCTLVLQFRAEQVTQGDPARARLYNVLRALLQSAITSLPIIDLILDSSQQERDAIRQASLADFPKQQQAWDAIREDRKMVHRWERLRKTEESREKRSGKKRKQVEAAEQGANAAISSASEKPRGRGAAPVAGKERKRLSQPSRALSEDELRARREKRVQRFLDEFQIEEKSRNVPELEDSVILIGLKTALLAKVQEKVTNEALLKEARSFLSNAMVEMTGQPSADLRKLVAELSSALVALEVAASDSSKAAEATPRDKPDATGQ